MICPKCHGHREFTVKIVNNVYVHKCDYCYGEGNVHCCEGDKEQPDPNRQETIYYSSEE